MSQATGRAVLPVQDAKQRSMGPDHDMSGLPLVLSEPLLGEARGKAEDFRQQGWAMRYRLWSCKVRGRQAGRQGQCAVTRVCGLAAVVAVAHCTWHHCSGGGCSILYVAPL